MLVSEEMEVDLDRKAAPHQFSTDYGPVRDEGLNAYVTKVGSELALRSHRSRMPYSFRVLNAVIVNGYTFPAGSVGIARGLVLEMEDESALAAVLGHEIGHVNARHGAERMSKNMLAMALVTGLSVYMQEEHGEYAALAAGLGGLGANLLLSRYSRDDEREADSLGMEYMARIGQNPRGMADIMATFRRLRKSRRNSVEILFSTHPMSEERYRNALAALDTRYRSASTLPRNRERYMDHTADLRKLRPAILEMQKGQNYMMVQKYGTAEMHLASALRTAPDDYAGLLMMSKCCLAQKRPADARAYAEKAKSVYPQEPQAKHMCGVAKLVCGSPDAALLEFAAYEKRLPGNPNTIFFRGRCLEMMGERDGAASEYMRYRRKAPSGEFAKHANGRLLEWGYLKPAPAQGGSQK